MLVKNWPDDPRLRCDAVAASLEDFGDAEADFLEELDEEFEEEIGSLVEDFPEEAKV